jgi:hypothetical protein
MKKKRKYKRKKKQIPEKKEPSVIFSPTGNPFLKILTVGILGILYLIVLYNMGGFSSLGGLVGSAGLTLFLWVLIKEMRSK